MRASVYLHVERILIAEDNKINKERQKAELVAILALYPVIVLQPNNATRINTRTHAHTHTYARTHTHTHRHSGEVVAVTFVDMERLVWGCLTSTPAMSASNSAFSKPVACSMSFGMVESARTRDHKMAACHAHANENVTEI